MEENERENDSLPGVRPHLTTGEMTDTMCTMCVVHTVHVC